MRSSGISNWIHQCIPQWIVCLKRGMENQNKVNSVFHKFKFLSIILETSGRPRSKLGPKLDGLAHKSEIPTMCDGDDCLQIPSPGSAPDGCHISVAKSWYILNHIRVSTQLHANVLYRRVSKLICINNYRKYQVILQTMIKIVMPLAE